MKFIVVLGIVAFCAISALAKVPGDFKRGTIVSSPKDSVVQWLVWYMYPDTQCQKSVTRTESMALGACIGGVDESGNPMQTWSTVLNATDGNSITVTDIYYKSTDCSGPASSQYSRTMDLNVCDNNYVMYLLKNSTDPAPWAGANKGVVVQDFSNAADCSGYSDVFQAISFDFCMGVADPGNGAQSMRYDSCSDDKITYTYYSDWGCEQKIETKEFSTSLCMTCPGSEHCYPQGFWYQTKETFICNA